LNDIKNGESALYFDGGFRYANPIAGQPEIVVGFCSRHVAQTVESGMDACGGYPPNVLLNGFPLQCTHVVQDVPSKNLGDGY
jgi:hypothetical protein